MFCRRFFLGLFFPLICSATSIPRLSFEQTVTQAEWIVSGDVVRNWCDWDSDHRFIWTHTEISVHESWKGSPGSTVTISEPGGLVNGVGLNVAGMVRYTPGEHVVVFLYRTPIGFIRTVGLGQGKLVVDSGGLVHPAVSQELLVNAVGVSAAGTSVTELESTSVSAVHDRVMRLRRGNKAASK